MPRAAAMAATPLRRRLIFRRVAEREDPVPIVQAHLQRAIRRSAPPGSRARHSGSRRAAIRSRERQAGDLAIGWPRQERILRQLEAEHQPDRPRPSPGRSSARRRHWLSVDAVEQPAPEARAWTRVAAARRSWAGPPPRRRGAAWRIPPRPDRRSRRSPAASRHAHGAQGAGRSRKLRLLRAQGRDVPPVQRLVRQRPRCGDAERARRAPLGREARHLGAVGRRGGLAASRRARPSHGRAAARAAPGSRCPCRSGARQESPESRGKLCQVQGRPSVSTTSGRSSTPSISFTSMSRRSGRQGRSRRRNCRSAPWSRHCHEELSAARTRSPARRNGCGCRRSRA